MIQRIARGMTWFVSRYLPDPLIFAIILTIIVFMASWGLTPSTPKALVDMWGSGF